VYFLTRRLVFVSYQHLDRARAVSLAARIRLLSLGAVRVFLSDPQDLFKYPIEELASRLSESHAVVQLLPSSGPSRWLIAERVFAKHLSIPVIQSPSPKLAPWLVGRIVRAVMSPQPFAPYSSYLRDAITSTYDPEAPTPRHEALLFQIVLLVSLVLAVHFRLATIVGGTVWLAYEIHAYRVKHVYADKKDLVKAWSSAVERAFQEVSEYGEHLKKIEDEYDWVGMSSTPMESNQGVRELVGRIFLLVLFCLTLVIDFMHITVRLLLRLKEVLS